MGMLPRAEGSVRRGRKATIFCPYLLFGACYDRDGREHAEEIREARKIGAREHRRPLRHRHPRKPSQRRKTKIEGKKKEEKYEKDEGVERMGEGYNTPFRNSIALNGEPQKRAATPAQPGGDDESAMKKE
ncbi:hypothetical protein H6P81_010105 [Aristolochia fimbriata]|uniref:Uncharacterized protein n=1 Tax=Aristolochia fimbriata TaxID=158543 RepID=A0AAV7EMW6_ARIFI|nr:hypothetical protein H6P81_010105 [Aristolochia fimbriata]